MTSPLMKVVFLLNIFLLYFCRFDWAWDPVPGFNFHLWRLWNHQHHSHLHPLQSGHQPWCFADLARGNRRQPTERRTCHFARDSLPRVIILILPCLSFCPVGSTPIRGCSRSGIPGPCFVRVTAFDSHCTSAWEGVQKNCPGARPHHPWRNPSYHSSAPDAQGPALLELTWAFQTREVNTHWTKLTFSSFMNL